jgi:predicted dehydrogenase
MRTAVRVGVVGLGGSSLELARTFDELPQSEVAWICAETGARHLRGRVRLAGARVTPDLDDLLADEALDAVVLTVALPLRYELIKRALEAGKHVLVTRLLADSGDHADELARLAERHRRQLMVGHTLLFHPVVRKLKELIEVGRLGELFYLYGSRSAVPSGRHGETPLWTLGAGDVAAILHLLGDEPVEVRARGETYVRAGMADVVFCDLVFATGIVAHLHLSWLDANLARRITAVGSRRTAVFDQLEVKRTLTLYEHGPVGEDPDALGRFGEIVCPRVSQDDAVRLQCDAFLARIRSSGEDLSGARQGAAVVNVLEALQRSLERDGAAEGSVRLGDPAKVVRLPVKSR